MEDDICLKNFMIPVEHGSYGVRAGDGCKSVYLSPTLER